MDDGLVLNIADGVQDAVNKTGNSKKGGRWTDRLKAKRVAKRKTQPSEALQSASAEQRPAKKPKLSKERPATTNEPGKLSSSARPPVQIISSLFSSNPKIDSPAPSKTLYRNVRPSNAPLTDSSTFSGLGLDPLLCAHLASKMDIEKPTSIQRAALSAILSPESAQERDLFIQSQTGSGKTLSYLLPLIHDLLPLSKLSYIDRSIGTLAVIIAPTRELAKQISDVLEKLLKLRLRGEDESADDGDAPRLTRWLVSGLLIGGATRTHEKAKLRKGVPILVSTPGRLLDHLQNTSSFNVGKCRWLVLDEADRLMELGFEETITGIIKGLEGRRNLAIKAAEEGIGHEVGGWEWGERRRTILCSATIREDVQKLAGQALHEPVMVKATGSEPEVHACKRLEPESAPSIGPKFTPPSQLSQKYVIVPLKLRLVVLVALLRSLIAQSDKHYGSKIIVFLSCTDSVDFHWNLLGGTPMDRGDVDDDQSPEDESSDEQNESKETGIDSDGIEVKSPLLPGTSIFRLHGSLPTQIRLASIQQFSKTPKDISLMSSSILFCTSVASRGLDLPFVRAVIQYDLPTEGGATEYVHRVGRTARAGKGGVAWSIVAPSEVEWVKWTETNMRGNEKGKNLNISLVPSSVEEILERGFGGKGHEYEERATEVQLSFERWVLRGKDNAALARKAYLAHMRAYATHPSNEKHMFHIKHLHLGHLAKAFALREAPKTVTGAKTAAKDAKRSANSKHRALNKIDLAHSKDSGRRMQEIVRAQGRLNKKGGMMMISGASEFQIAGGYDLEKLVHGSS